jgi:glycosyltransferase involved in cell wall biosynthesis
VKVLFATPYLPVPPDFGGARRMYELIRGTGREYQTGTLSLVGPTDDRVAAEPEIGSIVPIPVSFSARMAADRLRRTAQLRSLASAHSFQFRLYHRRSFQAALDRLVRTNQADLVQFEFSQMGSYRVRPGTPTILDVHNIEYDVLRQISRTGTAARRLFNLIEYRKFRREEIDAWSRASCCIATSTLDAAVIEQQIGRPVPVIPNGVDLEFFRRAPLSEATPGQIVFVGAIRYRPNAEAAMYFVERIFPLIRQELPETTFAIVGADPPASVRELDRVPGVTVAGTVPDVRPWLSAAQIVVVPLLNGGGTRLKILEAFASGRPVVSTHAGAEGIEVRDDAELLIADDPATFAHAVIQLGHREELRSRLTNAAYDLVRQRYQWSAITAELRTVQARLVSEPPPTDPMPG